MNPNAIHAGANGFAQPFHSNSGTNEGAATDQKHHGGKPVLPLTTMEAWLYPEPTKTLRSTAITTEQVVNIRHQQRDPPL